MWQVFPKYYFAKSQEKPHSFSKRKKVREASKTCLRSKFFCIQLSIAKMHAVVPSLFQFFKFAFFSNIFGKLAHPSVRPWMHKVDPVQSLLAQSHYLLPGFYMLIWRHNWFLHKHPQNYNIGRRVETHISNFIAGNWTVAFCQINLLHLLIMNYMLVINGLKLIHHCCHAGLIRRSIWHCAEPRK